MTPEISEAGSCGAVGRSFLLRRRSYYLSNVALGVLLAVAATGSGAATSPLSPDAFNLLNQRAAASAAEFYVYKDADSGSNHGFPSGFFGAVQNLAINAACVDDPNAAQGCSTNANRLDTARGTVARISFAPMAGGQFAGIHFEDPQGFVNSQAGVGYNLTGATRILFSVRSPTGITLQFGAGGQTTAAVTLAASGAYTSACVAVQGPAQQVCPGDASLKVDLTTGAINLASVHLLFTVATNDRQAPGGGVVLLDDIRYDPAPATQASSPGLPLSTQTFGIVPSQTAPFPPDQVNRNVATTYEASLALLALLTRGTTADRSNAQRIADALVYALGHDNSGDALPVAPGGATGLHNAYAAGDLALLNSQGPGAGQAGQIRLAGFSATGCGPSGFCLVFDGATGGDNAFAVLALLQAFKTFGTQSYLDAARTISNWIFGQLLDTSGTGFGGYFLGYPDAGSSKVLDRGKSTENNADIFAAFAALARVESRLGDAAAASLWQSRANIAGDFVIRMLDASRGCFNAGTVPPGITGSGIDPTGPVRGSDVTNRFEFLDANSFAWLALSKSEQYKNAISWSSVVSCIDRFRTEVSAAGMVFSGYSITRVPISGPNGIAWEFTGQAAVMLRLSGGDPTPVPGYMRTAQQRAPFGDGQGLVAATLQGGDTLPPSGQCLDTPFQCIPQRVGIAATAWAIFGEIGYNPFDPSPLLAAVLPSSRSVQVGVPATAFATIINTGGTTATACSIAPLSGFPHTFQYQTTDPRTNAVTGSLNTAVDIPANRAQTFVITLTPVTGFAPTDLTFRFACSNAGQAPIVTGLNTLLMSGSTSPVADVIALAATVGNNGILEIPGAAGAAAFAVATTNVGTGGPITAIANTGGVSTPLRIEICETNRISSACLQPPGASVTTTISAGAMPTFGIFAFASGAIPFDPTFSRIFVYFYDASGAPRGSTSVAVKTDPN